MATESGPILQRDTLSTTTVTQMPRACNPELASVVKTTYTENVFRDGNWSRSSVNTPGFNSPTRRGALYPNAFLYTRNEYQYAVGHWTTRYTTGCGNTNTDQQGCFGHAIGYSDVSPNAVGGVNTTTRDRLRANAANKLLSKIKNGSINVAVTAAEYRQTARTVGNAATRVASAIRHLKRGNIGQAAEAVGGIAGRRQTSRFNKQYAKDVEKAVASGWLELQYGWKPILNDVYGACDALARRNNRTANIRTTHKERYIQPLGGSKRTTSNSGKLINETWVEGERLTEVSISCTYHRPSGGIKQLSELGITNPAEVVWELIPYSFVVDWFLPIGSWLSTFDATLGLTFRSGYRTEFTKKDILIYTSQRGVDQYGAEQDMFKRSRETYINCQRFVLSTFPSPVVPRFKDPSSLSHLATGMALLQNLFRK